MPTQKQALRVRLSPKELTRGHGYCLEGSAGFSWVEGGVHRSRLSCPRGGVAASVSPSPERPADPLAMGHRDSCGSPGVPSQPGPWGPGPAVLRPSPAGERLSLSRLDAQLLQPCVPDILALLLLQAPPTKVMVAEVCISAAATPRAGEPGTDPHCVSSHCQAPHYGKSFRPWVLRGHFTNGVTAQNRQARHRAGSQGPF